MNSQSNEDSREKCNLMLVLCADVLGTREKTRRKIRCVSDIISTFADTTARAMGLAWAAPEIRITKHSNRNAI